MLPNDPARVPPRLAPAQQMIARDITREFVNAASSASLVPRGLLFCQVDFNNLQLTVAFI
jgi:hypothetical protein